MECRHANQLELHHTFVGGGSGHGSDCRTGRVKSTAGLRHREGLNPMPDTHLAFTSRPRPKLKTSTRVSREKLSRVVDGAWAWVCVRLFHRSLRGPILECYVPGAALAVGHAPHIRDNRPVITPAAGPNEQ